MVKPMSSVPHVSHSSRFSLKDALLVSGLMACSVLMKLAPYLLQSSGWEIDEADAYSYLWNFSPMLPLVLVLGSRYSMKTAAVLAGFTWLLGDLGIWAVTERFDWAFYDGSAIIYLCVFLVAVTGYLGSRLRPRTSLPLRIQTNIMSGLVGAILFFLVSNFFVWVNTGVTPYPHTLGGLIECYAMAIPFHRNDFFSMLIFVPLFTAILAPSAVEEVENIHAASVEKS